MNSNADIVKLAFADDHSLFRESLVKYLSDHSKIETIIQADNGKTLIASLETSKKIPDVCIMDINMPVMNGYETLKILQQRWPQIKILVMSMHNHEFAVCHMIRNGARGFVLKEGNPKTVIDAIQAIHYKGYYSSELLDAYPMKEPLTPKLNQIELDFLTQCCQDLHYTEIARNMNLSTRTVETYRDNLFKKLNLKSRTGLVIFAIQIGLYNINNYLESNQ